MDLRFQTELATKVHKERRRFKMQSKELTKIDLSGDQCICLTKAIDSTAQKTKKSQATKIKNSLKIGKVDNFSCSKLI